MFRVELIVAELGEHPRYELLEFHIVAGSHTSSQNQHFEIWGREMSVKSAPKFAFLRILEHESTLPFLQVVVEVSYVF